MGYITSEETDMNIQLTLNKREDGQYSASDVLESVYHGMRGNGNGRTSQMRYIGFPAEVAA